MIDTMTRWRTILKREWLLLLVPALIGLGLAFPLSSAKTPVSWTATERLAVYPVPSTLVEDFRPAALIVAAGAPAILRSAEATLGLASGALDGAFSAKADGSDPSLVVFSATAPTEVESLARLEAAVAAVRQRALSPYAYAVETSIEQAKSFSEVAADLEKRIADLDRLAASASRAEKAVIAQSQALYTAQLNDFRTRSTAAERTAGVVDDSVVVVSEPQSSRSSNSRLKVGLLIQGLVAGLAIGAIAAAAREWLLARRSAA